MCDIKKASVITALKDARNRAVGINGLAIWFTVTELVAVRDVFSFTVENETYYVEVRELSTIEADDNALELVATETGYWGNHFIKVTNFDIRQLIGIPLTKITDHELLARLETASSYT